MKFLILGGTVLVGRHIVEATLKARHEVTLFNRGKTNAHLFPDVEKLRGDRDGDLSALAGRQWDVVVDVNGYIPRHVRASAGLLKDHVGQYIYVSTGAVYQIPFPTNGDESAPLRTIEDDTSEDDNEYYGELKALCERAAEEMMPGRTLVLRLGLVAGRYDDSDRATYWAVRASKGGEMLVPGIPDDAFQVIHGADFGRFVVLAAEQSYSGVYNTTGEIITWGQWLAACKAVSGSDVALTWVPDRQFLLDNLERPYRSLPLYMPDSWGNWWTNNNDRAQALGLKYRPTTEIVRDILQWERHRPPDQQWRAGMMLAEEGQLLQKWHIARTSA